MYILSIQYSHTSDPRLNCFLQLSQRLSAAHRVANLISDQHQTGQGSSILAIEVGVIADGLQIANIVLQCIQHIAHLRLIHLQNEEGSVKQKRRRRKSLTKHSRYEFTFQTYRSRRGPSDVTVGLLHRPHVAPHAMHLTNHNAIERLWRDRVVHHSNVMRQSSHQQLTS